MKSPQRARKETAQAMNKTTTTKAEELTPAHYQQKRRAYPLPRLEDATTENKNPGGGFYNQIINY